MYDEKRRKGEIAAAIEIGVSQGFEKGHAEGIAEGIAEGHAKGLAEGIDKGIVLVAKNMLSAGFPYDKVSLATGLDMDSIKKLADQHD